MCVCVFVRDMYTYICVLCVHNVNVFVMEYVCVCVFVCDSVCVVRECIHVCVCIYKGACVCIYKGVHMCVHL